MYKRYIQAFWLQNGIFTYLLAEVCVNVRSYQLVMTHRTELKLRLGSQKRLHSKNADTIVKVFWFFENSTGRLIHRMLSIVLQLNFRSAFKIVKTNGFSVYEIYVKKKTKLFPFSFISSYFPNFRVWNSIFIFISIGRGRRPGRSHISLKLTEENRIWSRIAFTEHLFHCISKIDIQNK